MWRRPSCTATVCPTICGKIVEARLHVRSTFFSPVRFIASIFLSNFGSTYGPFFSDRDMLPSTSALRAAYSVSDYAHATRYLRLLTRRRTISRSVRLLTRVFLPRVGLPHGLFGPGIPVGERPSPPPCG